MDNLYWQSRTIKTKKKKDKKNLSVGTAQDYYRTFPYYSLPLEIGHYSINCEDEFCNDNHQLKYLSMPDRLTDLQMDLNEGYSEYISKTDEKDHYSILRWISSHQEDIKRHFSDGRISSKTNIDFVCYRGVLTAVTSTIYEKDNDWMIHATKFRSVIYLSQIETEQKAEHEECMTEREQIMVSWGHKFEQCITSDTMNAKPNTSRPVNEYEQYYVVLKGKLQNHRLLFAAETDAIDPQYCSNIGNDPSSIFRYVEIKTSKKPSHRGQWHFFRLKLLKWYLQCFLGGIPRVICGFRDNDGIVREIEDMNVYEMPEEAEGLWSAAACLNFLSHFLNYVKQRVVKDDPRVVYEFYWKPGSEVTCEELSPEYQFLSESYIKNVSHLKF